MEQQSVNPQISRKKAFEGGGAVYLDTRLIKFKINNSLFKP